MYPFDTVYLEALGVDCCCCLTRANDRNRPHLCAHQKPLEILDFLLDGNVELLDTFESKPVLLDEDTDGAVHELGGDLEDVLGHGGGQENDLGGLGEELEDIVDLLGETARQHLVGLVEAGFFMP